MDFLKSEQVGPYTITCRTSFIGASSVMPQLTNPSALIKKGRGEIKILSVNDKLLACRKYIHGGLLRGITRDSYVSEKRAAAELEIMMYLEEKGFPVVSPCGYIVEKKRHCIKSLHFLTFFAENDGDLLALLKSAHRKERLRAIKNLARLLFEMGRLGVFHPDLHLQNVLVTRTTGLLFLDFDRARLKVVTKKDFEQMFWRLNRFAEKKEKSDTFVVTMEERTLFLRTFERLSGYHVIEEMRKRSRNKHRFSKLGWLLERFLYKKDRQTDS
jgi:RIO-like serine/threonine protein kinase